MDQSRAVTSAGRLEILFLLRTQQVQTEKHGSIELFGHIDNNTTWSHLSTHDNTRYHEGQFTLNSGWQVPVGIANRPRSLGMLACAYMGNPAL